MAYLKLKNTDRRVKEKLVAKKVEDISSSINKKSQELGDVTSVHESKKREIDTMSKEVLSINNIIRVKGEEILSLEKLISRKNDELKELIAKHGEIDQSHREKILSLNEKENALINLDSSIQEKKEELELATHSWEKAELALFEANKNRKEIEKTIAAKFAILATRENDVDKKEKEVNDKLHKNGMILTRIEEQHGKLDLYVKRLQRYYNETGVNIQILDEFGIKGDNI